MGSVQGWPVWSSLTQQFSGDQPWYLHMLWLRWTIVDKIVHGPHWVMGCVTNTLCWTHTQRLENLNMISRFDASGQCSTGFKQPGDVTTMVMSFPTSTRCSCDRAGHKLPGAIHVSGDYSNCITMSNPVKLEVSLIVFVRSPHGYPNGTSICWVASSG